MTPRCAANHLSPSDAALFPGTFPSGIIADASLFRGGGTNGLSLEHQILQHFSTCHLYLSDVVSNIINTTLATRRIHTDSFKEHAQRFWKPRSSSLWMHTAAIVGRCQQGGEHGHLRPFSMLGERPRRHAGQWRRVGLGRGRCNPAARTRRGPGEKHAVPVRQRGNH